MDIAAILREIDAEIDKLKRIRNIVAALLQPAPTKKAKTKRKRALQPVEVIAEPLRIVLPAKEKREYRPRYKVAVPEPRALASVIPAKPVFVPKADVVARPELVPKRDEFVPATLEAAVRRNFLGVAS